MTIKKYLYDNNKDESESEEDEINAVSLKSLRNKDH